MQRQHSALEEYYKSCHLPKTPPLFLQSWKRVMVTTKYTIMAKDCFAENDCSSGRKFKIGISCAKRKLKAYGNLENINLAGTEDVNCFIQNI